MATGEKNVDEIGFLKKWNFESRMKFLNEDCSKISGSAGEIYVPGMKKEKHVTFFSPELCRNVFMDFDEEQEINGVEVFKYSPGDLMMDNGTLYPDNICYCNGDCVPSGLFNVSACNFGLPVFMSLPHFYKADPYYISEIDGMKPDKDKHDASLSFEPVIKPKIKVIN